MGQILGLGITHYPPLSYKGNMTGRIKLLVADPLLPERLRTPAGWHPTAREQWSTDEGAAHSDKHRDDLIHHFRKARAELDAFQPDFVLLWGDDQYENYREDCVPPFSILAYDSVDVQPWKGHRGENWWTSPRTRRSRLPVTEPVRNIWRQRCSATAWTSRIPTSRCTTRSATRS